MTGKIVVRFLGVLFMLVFAAGMPILFAGDSGNGCKLQGSWLGEVTLLNSDVTVKFVSTYFGTGDNNGTEEVAFINMPPVFPGTSYRGDHGVWTKSGPNRYDFTELAFIVNDATNAVILVQRASGTKILTDCDTLTADATLEYLDPATMEPIPGWTMPAPAATAKRMHVQQPAGESAE